MVTFSMRSGSLLVELLLIMMSSFICSSSSFIYSSLYIPLLPSLFSLYQNLGIISVSSPATFRLNSHHSFFHVAPSFSCPWIFQNQSLNMCNSLPQIFAGKEVVRYDERCLNGEIPERHQRRAGRVKSACRSSSWKSRHDVSSSPLVVVAVVLDLRKQLLLSHDDGIVIVHTQEESRVNSKRRQRHAQLVTTYFPFYVISSPPRSPLHSVVV